MRLTNTTEYAMRVMATMANEPDELFSVRALHEALRIPRKYLGSLMSQLAQAGLLVATRGKYGGYQLAKPAKKIPLLSVVDVCEGLSSYSRCMLGLNQCKPKRPCALHHVMVAQRKTLIRLLKTTTIEDLAQGRTNFVGT